MVTGIMRGVPPLAGHSTNASARGPLAFRVVRCATAFKVTAMHNAASSARCKMSFRRRMLMQVNDKAPDFTLLDQDENSTSLPDFRGKTVVLYFFPKANTPG